jgi:hypothetical protein
MLNMIDVFQDCGLGRRLTSILRLGRLWRRASVRYDFMV